MSATATASPGSCSRARPGRRATLWVDDAYGYLMLFTGDTLAPGARRRGLAVEPMTCAPNALQSGDGLVDPRAGRSHTRPVGHHARLSAVAAAAQSVQTRAGAHGEQT